MLYTKKIQATIFGRNRHLPKVYKSRGNTQYGDRALPDIEPQPLTAEALAAQLAQWEDRLGPPSGAPPFEEASSG